MAALSPLSDSNSVNQDQSLSSDEDQHSGIERAKEFIVWTVGRIGDTFIHLMKNGFIRNAEVQIILITVWTLATCYTILDEETDNCDEESDIDSDEYCEGPSDDQHIESEEENNCCDEVNDFNSNECCEGHSDDEHIESEEEMAEVDEYRGIQGAKSVLEKVLSSMMNSTVKTIEMHMGVPEMMGAIFTRILCICALLSCYAILLNEEEEDDEDDSEEESGNDSDESCENASDVENIVESEQKEDVIEQEERNAGETSDTASSRRVTGSRPKRTAGEEISLVLGSTGKRRRT